MIRKYRGYRLYPLLPANKIPRGINAVNPPCPGESSAFIPVVQQPLTTRLSGSCLLPIQLEPDYSSACQWRPHVPVWS